MKRKIIRLCVFLLGFVWLVIFANTFLIKTDTYARLTLGSFRNAMTFRSPSSVLPSCGITSTPK